MGKDEQVDTQKAELKEIAETIERNLYTYYPKPPLPEIPFFLDTPNEASDLLRAILVESSYDHKLFSMLASKRLLKFKELECEFQMKKASHLKEVIDISTLLQEISKLEITSTSLNIKVQKSQSYKGPITLKVKLGGKELKLEESDVKSLDVKITDIVKIDFIVDDDGSQFIIHSESLPIAKIIDEIYYMKAAEKQELEYQMNKKGAEFEVKVNFKLVMSIDDRKKILNKKYHEVNNIIGENDKNAVVYKDMQSSLMVNFNDDEQTFKSSIRKRKARETCCEACLVF
jgi:hypothetical protein